jgi:hypothetical protein
MAQNTQKHVQKLQQVAAEAPEGSQQSIRSNTSLFALMRAGQGQDVENKQAFLGDIRQKLAQVADDAKKNGDDNLTVEHNAAVCATRLYQARITGLISGDELTSLLGDTFGYAPKQDGTPGKSPTGKGKTIRQRVVRAVQGHDWLNGADGGRFFEALDKEAVKPLIDRIGMTEEVDEGGQTVKRLVEGASIWDVYKKLGDLKSQGTVRLDPAFDAKKIAALTERLSEAGAREALLSNPTLITAYEHLFNAISILTTVDASEEAEIAAKLGVSLEPETVSEEGEEMAA